MKNISILGCGWLGLPLAKSLLQDGYNVKGTTTSPEKLQILRESGIEAYVLKADPDFDPRLVKSFFETDILIVNIPPPRREDVLTYHSRQIDCIVEQIVASGTDYVLFVSSTSVYPNTNGKVTEEDDLEPVKPSGKALKAIEKKLSENSGFKTTILRLSGLIGYDRNPRNFLKRRTPRARSNAPVNLIHRDDCIEIIKKIIKNDLWGETLNASSDSNPMRREFYESEAEKSGIDLENYFDKPHSGYKLVSNEKLKKLLNYSFIYPDPLKIDK